VPNNKSGTTAMSHIKGFVGYTVYLGHGHIGDTLVIESTGGVLPTAYGAAAVVSDVTNGILINHGQVIGADGGGTVNYGNGGVGVLMSDGGTILNSGTIRGGFGSHGTTYYDRGGNGGVGIDLAGGILNNRGTIIGGGGGYGRFDSGYGAIGVSLSNASGSNTGTIVGGHGGDNYDGQGGKGAAGVQLQGGTFSNAGMIEGGDGGSAYYGGNGGAGVVVLDATLTNSGVIAGGRGAYGERSTYGGAGVLLGGGTLTNAGTITGGAAAYGGQAGYAVEIEGGATLILDPGSVLNGAVLAASSDTLILAAGSHEGTLSSRSSAFTGFGDVKVAAGASWDLDTTTSLAAHSSLQVLGTLSVGGSLRDRGTATIGAGGVLNPGTSGAVLVDGISMAGGRLTETAHGRLVIGTAFGHATTGTLTIQAGASVIGEGTVTAPRLSIGGALTADGGTLTVHADVTGAGNATINAGATLDVFGTLAVAGVDFAGAGATLALDKPTDATSTLSGFGAGDTIDLVRLLANQESYSNGTLSLLEGSSVVATLAFAGNYNSNDFTLTSDGNGGTTIGFTSGAAPHDFGWQDAAAAPTFAEAGWAGGHIPLTEDWTPPLHVPAHSAGW
jgi:hypothetical protein